MENKAKLVTKEKLSADINRFDFESILDFRFESGQFIMVDVGDSYARAYSVASSPKTLPNFSLIIGNVKEGIGTSYFQKLRIGDVISFSDAKGKFVLPSDVNGITNLTFICTGTGLAPVMSMIEDIKDKDFHITLLFGTRDKESLICEDWMQDMKKEGSIKDYEIYLSREICDGYRHGYVTDSPLINNPNISKTRFFICGKTSIVASVRNYLLSIGAVKDNLYFESYG